MTAAWFLLVLGAGAGDADANAPRTRDVVFARTTIRYLVRCDEAVERFHLTTLVPESAPDWQEVLAVEFEPKPEEVFVRDGQRYARFEVENPAAETILEVRARIAVVSPGLDARPTLARRVEVDADEWKRVSRPERFLESDSDAVRSLRRRISGDGTIARARSALELTLENLAPAHYNSSDVGAKVALEVRRGDCTEYADVLTALLRADGIPARHCYGFLLASASTPKHDWVEFHVDSAGWVAVDPFHVERGAATFETLKPNYLRLSTLRNDDRLAGYHFFSWKNVGGRAQVVDEFEAEIAQPPDAEPDAPAQGTPPPAESAGSSSSPGDGGRW